MSDYEWHAGKHVNEWGVCACVKFQQVATAPHMTMDSHQSDLLFLKNYFSKIKKKKFSKISLLPSWKCTRSALGSWPTISKELVCTSLKMYKVSCRKLSFSWWILETLKNSWKLARYSVYCIQGLQSWLLRNLTKWDSERQQQQQQHTWRWTLKTLKTSQKPTRYSGDYVRGL